MALTIIEQKVKYGEESICKTCAHNKVCRYMDNQPCIECSQYAAQERHGRWVEIKGMAPPEYHGKHRCSICCARALERKFHEELSEHCPNCGAKMDGDKHDTEE